jgi:hypothetical protein
MACGFVVAPDGPEKLLVDVGARAGAYCNNTST